MKIDGGCHCGFVTYEAEADPEKATICHCTDCQQLSGSAFRTVVPVESSTFHMSGQPTFYLKTAESGNKREQSFCPRCGSPIYSAPSGGGERLLFIRVGTINQRDQFIPRLQVWAGSQQSWVDGLASVRKIDKQDIPGLATQK